MEQTLKNTFAGDAGHCQHGPGHDCKGHDQRARDQRGQAARAESPGTLTGLRATGSTATHASHGHGHTGDHHAGHRRHGDLHQGHSGTALNRVAFSATVHCLTGCAIGEVAGMVIGTALGWSNLETIALAVTLAFISGFAMTMLPLLRNNFSFGQALRLALAADTASIAIMELVDNGVMLLIPGAMAAPLDSAIFWGSLAIALLVAGAAAFPVNRWLIVRGRGHAVVHQHH